MQPTHPQQSQPYHPPYPGPSNNTARAVQAVSAALLNPYGQAYGGQSAYPQASHYAQAYRQYYNGAGPSHVTADGYTISSTYVPGTQYHTPQPPRPATQRPPPHGGGQGQAGWYQTGNCRCTTPGCSFTGSKKTVEVHMMDRHLVHPPGWEHRKKRQDWDADPSLKGKPVPIQGTSIKLDTPEAIEQWIAERRKRFPTTQNVDDKQRKMREAIERGQIPFDDASRRNKRRRVDDGPGDRDGNPRGGRGGQRGRGRGRGRGRAQDGGWEGRRPAGQTVDNAATSTVTAAPPSDAMPTLNGHRDQEAVLGEDAGSDSDSDGVPEVVSSKGPPTSSEMQHENSMEVDEEGPVDSSAVNVLPQVAGPVAKPVQKPRPRQPRRPLYNPFSQRASLLRNLLLPEIRVTVSNLSQAIHFLVDNDFLDDVELKPGQASERRIQVIGEQSAPTDAALATVSATPLGEADAPPPSNS